MSKKRYDNNFQNLRKGMDEKEGLADLINETLTLKGSFLDIGANDGKLGSLLEGDFNEKVAVEPNAEACDTLRNSGYEVHEMGYEKFDNDKKFDFVLASHVLYYIPIEKWADVVEDMYNRVEKNGNLAVILTTGGSYWDMCVNFFTEKKANPNMATRKFISDAIETYLGKLQKKVITSNISMPLNEAIEVFTTYAEASDDVAQLIERYLTARTDEDGITHLTNENTVLFIEKKERPRLEIDIIKHPYDRVLVKSLKDKRVAIPGRYNPLHNGHLSMFIEIIKAAGVTFIPLGSANETHSRNNPCSAVERRNYIMRALNDAAQSDDFLRERMKDVRVIPIQNTGLGDGLWSINEQKQWISSIYEISGGIDLLISSNPQVAASCKSYGIDCRHVTEVVRKESLLMQGTLHDKLSATHIKKLIDSGHSEYKDLIPHSVLEVLQEIGGIENRLNFSLTQSIDDSCRQPYVDCIIYKIDSNGQMMIGVDESDSIPRIKIENGEFEDLQLVRYFQQIGLDAKIIDPYRLPLRLQLGDGLPRNMRRVRTYRENKSIITAYVLSAPESNLKFVDPGCVSSESTRCFMEFIRGNAQ